MLIEVFVDVGDRKTLTKDIDGNLLYENGDVYYKEQDENTGLMTIHLVQRRSRKYTFRKEF